MSGEERQGPQGDDAEAGNVVVPPLRARPGGVAVASHRERPLRCGMVSRSPLRSRRSRPVRRAVPALLAVAACLAAPLPAVAQDAASGAGEGAAAVRDGTSAAPSGPSVAEAPPVPADWTRYVDPEAGFTIDVPPGVLVQRVDAGWYVQLLNPDGSVGLPGMAIYPDPGATLDELLAQEPGSDVRTEEVPLGPGTTGVRVVATYETMAAGRFQAVSYLVPFDGGVHRLVGWEDLAWEPFERVARSFTFTEPVEAR